MGVTFDVGTVHDADYSTSVETWSHDGGSGPDFAVVLIAQHDNDGDPSGLTYGGVAMTKLTSILGTLPERHVAIWTLDSGVPSGVQNVSGTWFTNQPSRALCVTGTTPGTPAFVAATSMKSNMQPQLTLDSGSDVGRALLVSDAPYASTGAYTSALSGNTEIGDVTGCGFSSEDADASGSRAVGMVMATTTDIAVAGVIVCGGDIIITPDPVGMEVGFNAGVVALSGTPTINAARMRGFVLAFRDTGRIGVTAQRQVSFVGGGIETPEMSEGGDEGDVLTQHLGRPATWENAGSHVHSRRWVPMVWRPDPVGSPDDWQLLHADDGTVMMTWVED